MIIPVIGLLAVFIFILNSAQLIFFQFNWGLSHSSTSAGNLRILFCAQWSEWTHWNYRFCSFCWVLSKLSSFSCSMDSLVLWRVDTFFALLCINKSRAFSIIFFNPFCIKSVWYKLPFLNKQNRPSSLSTGFSSGYVNYGLHFFLFKHGIFLA